MGKNVFFIDVSAASTIQSYWIHLDRDQSLSKEVETCVKTSALFLDIHSSEHFESEDLRVRERNNIVYMDLHYTKPPFISRTAIDSMGCLGSFYDATIDRVFEHCIRLPAQTIKLSKRPLCLMERFRSDEVPNLLKLINMHPAVRLSVALEMISARRIAAASNYKYSLDKYTRILRYSLTTEIVEIPERELEKLRQDKLPISEPSSTHLIVQVHYGIEALVILQLRGDDTLVHRIDPMLGQLVRDLNEDRFPAEYAEQIDALNSISSVIVYSNISSIHTAHSIIDFTRQIHQLRLDSSSHRPSFFALCPVDYLFAVDSKAVIAVQDLAPNESEALERCLIELKFRFKRLHYWINREYPCSQKYFKSLDEDIAASWLEVQKLYDQNLQQLRKLVRSIRRCEMDVSAIQQSIRSPMVESLEVAFDQLWSKVNFRIDKEYFIRDQLPKGFHYRHAQEFNIVQEDTDETLQHKLIRNQTNIRVLCGTDQLHKDHPSEWSALHDTLLQEMQKNENLRVIYVDFTNHPYSLNQFKLFKTGDITQEDDTINVVLVGQSRVGKSTFVNALANYLRFQTFAEATAHPPVVLIQASFPLLNNSGSNEEIKCDGLDTLNSEDHEHPGQSVTQHCRSYFFPIVDHQNKRRILRLIDTPGFGDSRGLDQDEKNLREILLYLNNLTHLNAICVLVKSNVSEIHAAFRSYLLHLFDFLGKNARENLLFCFTHTGPCFYTPGQSSRLVRQSLNAFPIPGVVLNNDNTFCFDSGAFRYLVAKERGIQFDTNAIERYRKNWEESTKQVKRLFNDILLKLQPYELYRHFRSMKRAQLEIQLLIRPIMEAVRNLLRNLVLSVSTSNTSTIQFHPFVVADHSATCMECVHELQECAGFYILCDPLHSVRIHCSTCSCPPNRHTFLYYQLEYQKDQTASKPSIAEIQDLLKILCETSVRFACFLMNRTNAPDYDQVRSQLENIIHEEQCICAECTTAALNSKLVEELKIFQRQYDQAMEQSSKQPENLTDLTSLYRAIHEVNQIDIVQSQMNAVRRWHDLIFKQSEFHVPLT